MDLCISGFINILDLKWSVNGEVIAAALSLITTSIVIVAPILVFIFLKKFKEKFEEKEFNSKFGDLYDGFKLEADSNAYLYNFFFLLRRLAFTASLVFLKYEPYF